MKNSIKIDLLCYLNKSDQNFSIFSNNVQKFIQYIVVNAHRKILITSNIEFYRNYFADW